MVFRRYSGIRNVIFGLFAQNRQNLRVKLTVLGVLSLYSISFRALMSDFFYKKALFTNCVLQVKVEFVLQYLLWFAYARRSKFRLCLIRQTSQFLIFFKKSLFTYFFLYIT
jgi:hypothetical protein